jgi:type VI protein secretion system component Hcp
LCLFALGLLAFGAQPALAQVYGFSLAENPPIFLKIPGISGNASSMVQHLGEIEVISIRQTYSAYAPATGRRPCSLTLVKPLDKSGPKLWVAAVTGQVFSQIEVAVVNENAANPYTAYKITLTNSRVVGITTESQGAFLETVTFEGDSAILAITQQLATGQPSGTLTSTVSCAPVQ